MSAFGPKRCHVAGLVFNRPADRSEVHRGIDSRKGGRCVIRGVATSKSSRFLTRVNSRCQGRGRGFESLRPLQSWLLHGLFRELRLGKRSSISRRQRAARAPVGRANVTVRCDFNGIGRCLRRCWHNLVATPRQSLEHVRRESRFS